MNLDSPPDTFKLRKPVDQMSPEEMCLEAARLREHISVAAEQLSGIYSTLYSTVLRRKTGSTTELSTGEVYAYRSVANAGKRMAGVVLQAMKRTSHVDRLVENAKADAEQAEKDRLWKEQKAESRAASKEAAQSKVREARARLFGHDAQVTQDSLIELYGNH